MPIDWSERALGIWVDTRVIGDVAILQVKGELPQHDYSLVGAMRQQLANGYRRILVNLQELRHTGDYGVANLITCYVEIKEAGGTMKVVANPYIDNVLKITHLRPVLNVHPTEGDALASAW
jgi:anti-anti-sigma factor